MMLATSWTEDDAHNAEVGAWIKQNKPTLEAAFTNMLGQPVAIDDTMATSSHSPYVTLSIEGYFWGHSNTQKTWKAAWKAAEQELGHTVGGYGGFGPADNFGKTKAKKVCFTPTEFEAVFCNL